MGTTRALKNFVSQIERRGKARRRQAVRRIQQALEFLMRVDVGSKGALRSGARLLQGGGGQRATAHQIVEEAAERVMLILPKAGGRACPVAKGGTRVSGNSVEW